MQKYLFFLNLGFYFDKTVPEQCKLNQVCCLKIILHFKGTSQDLNNRYMHLNFHLNRYLKVLDTGWVNEVQIVFILMYSEFIRTFLLLVIYQISIFW